MKKHIHTEAEFNSYLTAAANHYEDFNCVPHYEYAEQAVAISRTLHISIDNAEFLMDTYNVYIPKHKDRDLAIMVLEMGITFEQAKTLYEVGFHLDDMPQPEIDPFSLPNPDEVIGEGIAVEDNGFSDIKEEPYQPF